MPLIDRHARVIEDLWTYADSTADAEIAAKSIIEVEVLASLAGHADVPQPIGVFARAGTTAEQLAPHLDRVELVAVEFPKFRDGRGFTTARMLRDKYGFRGEIRAIGHVLPDQFAALLQCGFSSILLPPDHPPDQWVIPSAGSSETTHGPLLQRLLRKPMPSAAEPGAS